MWQLYTVQIVIENPLKYIVYVTRTKRMYDTYSSV